VSLCSPTRVLQQRMARPHKGCRSLAQYAAPRRGAATCKGGRWATEGPAPWDWPFDGQSPRGNEFAHRGAVPRPVRALACGPEGPRGGTPTWHPPPAQGSWPVGPACVETRAGGPGSHLRKKQGPTPRGSGIEEPDPRGGGRRRRRGSETPCLRESKAQPHEGCWVTKTPAPLCGAGDRIKESAHEGRLTLQRHTGSARRALPGRVRAARHVVQLLLKVTAGRRGLTLCGSAVRKGGRSRLSYVGGGVRIHLII
jgi:hypothetical protein